MDLDEYYEGYKEWAVEELWDSIGREPTESEIDNVLNMNDFRNYMQGLVEAYHEKLYC